MERPYEAPTTRQMVFAAICGIFTAGTTFVFWPHLFRTLYLCYLEPIYEYQMRENEFLGFLKFIVLDLPALVLVIGSIAVIFLYLNKKQKTGPYCFWINLFCQYGILYFFYAPFEQIVFLHTGYFGPGLGELLLPILLPRWWCWYSGASFSISRSRSPQRTRRRSGMHPPPTRAHNPGGRPTF